VLSDETTQDAASRQFLLPILSLLLLVLVLAFLVFRPFALTFTAAAAVALLLGPAQRYLTRRLRMRGSLAAGLLVLGTTLVILAPIVGSLILLGNQAVIFVRQIGPRLQPAELERIITKVLPERAPWLAELLAATGNPPVQLISESLSRLASGANTLIQGTLAHATTAFFELGLFLLMLFFLLRDGGALRVEVRRVSPLSSGQEAEVFDHIARTVKGVLQAMVVVPIAQGILAGVGFWLFGIPSPLLWGVMVMFAAFVPVLGSPLGWLPVVFYKFDVGPADHAVWLAVYCLLIVSGSDNVIKPLLLRGSARIHPLLGFLAILGGLIAFGPLGFLVGPIVLSLGLSAIRIYRDDVLRSQIKAAYKGASREPEPTPTPEPL
jgi:predicted PurR-regulated permease PerM